METKMSIQEMIDELRNIDYYLCFADDLEDTDRKRMILSTIIYMLENKLLEG